MHLSFMCTYIQYCSSISARRFYYKHDIIMLFYSSYVNTVNCSFELSRVLNSGLDNFYKLAGQLHPDMYQWDKPGNCYLLRYESCLSDTALQLKVLTENNLKMRSL